MKNNTLTFPNSDLPTDIIPIVPGAQEVWQSRLDLLKRTVAKGASDEEFELFVMRARQTGLDPFSGQIMAVMRYDGGQKRNVMTIQIGIHGLRLIADRTGRYAPGPPTAYEYSPDGTLRTATAYVQKFIHGDWIPVSETAHFEEFAQYYTPQGAKEEKLTHMWAEKPHLMLAKCAEALALRRAFPAELSGLYTDDEMPPVTETVTLVDRSTGELLDRPRNPTFDPAEEERAGRWSDIKERSKRDKAYQERVLVVLNERIGEGRKFQDMSESEQLLILSECDALVTVSEVGKIA